VNRQRWKTWTVLFLAAFGGQAAPASVGAAESAFLVGGGQALWLIVSEDDLYRLAVKWRDQPWAKLAAEAQGEVAAATVVEEAAVVFFNSGRSVRYFPYQQEEQYGERAPQSLWPVGTRVLAACPAAPEGAAALVLVSRPAVEATQPAATQAAATGPTSAAIRPLSVELAVLRLEGQEWQQLAVVGPQRTGWPGRAHLAVSGGKVYILVERPERTFLVLEQGRWNKLALPAEPATGAVLALMGLKEQLLMAVFDPAGSGGIGIARYVSGKWQEVQFLQAAGKALTWPEQNRPGIGWAGDAVALAWQEQDKWLVADFDLQGQRVGAPEDIFARAGAVESADRAKTYFLWGVLLVLIVLMFWPGQALRTVPFSLPPTMRPAQLGRRALAFLIDVVPFAGVAYYLAGGSQPDDLLRSLKEGPEVEQIYALLGFLVAYPVYCIFLERLFGATFGKMAMRMRVIGDGGKRPTLRELALRNVSKIPEMMTVFLLLFPLLTRYRQRLGDKIAWTAVIDMELSPPPEPPQDLSQRPRAGDGSEREDEKP
jgi:uncharacterized RDD family membrane protein YckC